MIRNPKRVKYKVTTMFGDIAEGTVITAWQIAGDGSTALLFHPKTSRGTCGSVELCMLGSDRCYISLNDNSYINLEGSDLKRFEQLVAKVKD